MGILKRYAPAALPPGRLIAPPSYIGHGAEESVDEAGRAPFYSQLYRNLVFAIYMANKLDVRWGLVNLLCGVQFRQRPEFQDPTQFIRALLPEKSSDRFLFYSWERLYADHLAKAPEVKDLAEYMCNKTANGVKALAV